MVRLSLSQFFIQQIVNMCSDYVESCDESGDIPNRDDMLIFVKNAEKRGVTSKGKPVKSSRKKKCTSGYNLYSTIFRSSINKQIEEDENCRTYEDKNGDTHEFEFDGTHSFEITSKISGYTWRKLGKEKHDLFNKLRDVINNDDENKELDTSNHIQIMDELEFTDEQKDMFISMCKPKIDKDNNVSSECEEEEDIPKKKLPKKKSTRKTKQE